MKALLKTSDGVEIADVPVPRPGPGEVLVKVKVAGLCRTDLYVADGSLPVEEPRILGHECSGVVYRVGPEVEQEMLGRRVTVFPWIGCMACEYCRGDQEKLGYLCPERRFVGWHLDGAFAEYMVVPAHRCITLEEDFSFQAGAFLEPLVAALGVIRAPIRDARNVAIVGRNRIANLTSAILKHYTQVEHDQLSLGQGTDNSYDLVIETSVDEKSLDNCMRLIRPDGVLVLKSRPALSVPWPVRLQVEKEITTMALGYGSLKLALMLLGRRQEIFEGIWAEPVPLDEWSQAFATERESGEEKKIFFIF